MPATPSQLRIAFVTGSLHLGGSTTLLMLLARSLRDAGAAVEIHSMEEDHPLADEFTRHGLTVHRHSERRLIFEDRVRSVLQGLAKFRPAVVVACLGGASYEILRYVPAGVRRIGLAVSDDPAVYAMMRPYAGCLDIVAGNAETIVRKLGAFPEFERLRREWFVTGVEVPPSRERMSKPEDPLRIVSLSRLLKEQKRVDLFPEILGHLERAGRPMVWTVAGEGRDRAEIEPAMRGLARNVRVEFPGAIPFSEVDAFLAGQDVFLLTSDYEGLPLALVHAMMNGVVPVVSDIPSGIPELVNASTGMLVNVRDVEGYARAILELDGDRPRLLRLAGAARAIAEEKYSVGTMAGQWLGFIGEPAPPPVWPTLPPPIRTPLGERRRFYFSPLVRMLRRWALRRKHR